MEQAEATRSPSVEESERVEMSPPPQNLSVCRSPIKVEEIGEKRTTTPERVNVETPPPSDMTMHNSMGTAMNPPIICTRLPSPIAEPLPGPSNLPPVQQVPLVRNK